MCDCITGVVVLEDSSSAVSRLVQLPLLVQARTKTIPVLICIPKLKECLNLNQIAQNKIRLECDMDYLEVLLSTWSFLYSSPGMRCMSCTHTRKHRTRSRQNRPEKIHESRRKQTRVNMYIHADEHKHFYMYCVCSYLMEEWKLCSQNLLQ